MRQKVKIFVFLILLAGAGFFYVSHQTASSHGENISAGVVEIKPGDNVFDVAKKLQQSGFISWQGYFVYYFWKEDLRHSILAGKYGLSGALTIPEIARIITRGDVVPQSIPVTFPEGWGMRKMADRLTARGLPGEEFLQVAKNPKPEWRSEFWFLKDLPEDATLEGFLFPDTYVFATDVTAEEMVRKMLKNFENKLPDEEKSAIEKQSKNFFDVVVLASIVENEVRSEMDRRMVADLFLRRLDIDQPLQSDATVQYVRGENTIQHSFEETRVESPYNTYINKGLPPGPISNPGLESLLAVMHPATNPYFYFLTDTNTGETIFSVTFDEHITNKGRHGL